MIKKFLLNLLREDISRIADLRAEEQVWAHREWICSSLVTSFKSVNDKIDRGYNLSLETSAAVERLSIEVDLLGSAVVKLEDDTDMAFGFVAEKIDDLAMGLDICFDLIDDLEDDV